jgi:hypothetical protein
MIKRALLLCLGFWLIVSSALLAHAGPCGMDRMAAETVARVPHPAHCDLMAAPDEAPLEMPPAQDTDAVCCCPAVLATLALPAAPEAGADVFAEARGFPLDTHALSRVLVPEPHPPKA